MTIPAASQLLQRLRSWGYVRRSGFERGDGAGRGRNVYEVTAKAHRAFAEEEE
jgi:DNA-binding PadR family transcriptional regulator